MAQTVIGMFDSAAEAQQAVLQLVSKGFSRDSIDVSSRSSDTTTSGSYETPHEEEGGIGNFFKNLFGDDDDDRDKYSHVASKSGSLVTVHTQSADEAEQAADILDDAGAVNVDEKASQYGYSGSGSSLGSGTTSLSGTDSLLGTSATTGIGSLGADNSLSAATTGTNSIGSTGLNTTSDNDQKIQVIEENLQVGKREVLTGGKRLRSRIIERPIEESVRLREENVTVNRTPVDRPATSADLSNFQGTEIEMTETKEVPVVSKEARVVEEVSLGKSVEQRTETVSDTVRKTEVDIEDIDRPGTGQISSDETRSTTDYNPLNDKNSF